MPRYRQMGLLTEGAIADQDAYLWEAVAVIRSTLNTRLLDTLKAQSPKSVTPATGPRRRR